MLAVLGIAVAVFGIVPLVKVLMADQGFADRGVRA